MSKFAGLVIVSSAGAFLAGGGYTVFAPPTPLTRSVLPDASCDIKGNVSINSGEHIYHVPGQERYLATKISPEYGERWFCTEAEARDAGWRKAGR